MIYSLQLTFGRGLIGRGSLGAMVKSSVRVPKAHAAKAEVFLHFIQDNHHRNPPSSTSGVQLLQLLFNAADVHEATSTADSDGPSAAPNSNPRVKLKRTGCSTSNNNWWCYQPVSAQDRSEDWGSDDVMRVSLVGKTSSVMYAVPACLCICKLNDVEIR